MGPENLYFATVSVSGRRYPCADIDRRNETDRPIYLDYRS